jgi:hypothetical protein
MLAAAIVCLATLGSLHGQSILHLGRGGSEQYLGHSLAKLDDVDGDGTVDLLVGAPNDLGGLGSVTAVSGRDSSVLYRVTGQQLYEALGFSLSSVGDLDGDGIQDFVASGPNWEAGTAVPAFVRVYSGRTGQLLETIQGETLIGFGQSVSAAGDVNADGFLDFAVGAPFRNEGPVDGEVFVYSGEDASLLRDWVYISPGYSLFGAALSAAGDVNGDGFDDLLIGAPDGSITDYDSGFARVLSGKDGEVLFSFNGTGRGDNLGDALRGGIDLNGDSIPDFILGAPQTNEDATGYVSVRSGSDGVELSHLVPSDGSLREFGASLDVADIDGDGKLDLLIGSPGNKGAVLALSPSDGRELLAIHGDKSLEYLGGSLAACGDLNHDGFPEFLTGSALDYESYYLVVSPKSYDAMSETYGSGWPGGTMPSLTASDPFLGQQMQIFLSSSSGDTTWAVLFFGLTPAELPTPWGGTLLLVPTGAITLTVPFFGLSFEIAVPSDVMLAGVTVYAQAVQGDQWATRGVSFTPGLRLVLGGMPAK